MISSEMEMSRETADRRRRERARGRERVKDRIKGGAAATAAFLPHVAGAHDCLRYCPSESPAIAMLRALLLLRPENRAGFLDTSAPAKLRRDKVDNFPRSRISGQLSE